MVNSKEAVLFIIRFIEAIISTEAKNIQLTLIDKKLILNIKQKKYNKNNMNIFIEHYNSKILEELFDNQITKIEIKS